MKSKNGKKVNQHNKKETKNRTSKVSIVPSFFLDFQTLKKNCGLVSTFKDMRLNWA